MNPDVASSEAEAGSGPPQGRNPKACQQCRRRKIRCDGGEPCRHCQQKNVDCEYRGFVRQRKRKHEVEVRNDVDASDVGNTDGNDKATSRSAFPRAQSSSEKSAGAPKSNAALRQTENADGRRNRRRSAGLTDYGVAATHVASPSCVMQLYYGPHSNFSLMQLMYRQLVDGLGNSEGLPNHNSSSSSRQREEVEEVGPGLDLFSFRRLFFGDLAGNQDASLPGGALDPGSNSVFFIRESTASRYLERYLSTFYYLAPWKSKDFYRQELVGLFDKRSQLSSNDPQTTLLILMLALGAIEMKDDEMGDCLYKKAKANAMTFDDIVNVQTIQVPILMAKPNSAFMCLGNASRKALAAGLHKNTRFKIEQTMEDAEEKRLTFWCLFFYDIWICFGLGRPMTIPADEITIPDPKEQPLLLALVEIARIMSRAARKMYSQRHESLLTMWKNAREIRRDLQVFAQRVQGVMNFGLDASPKSGEVGLCQIVLQLLYHTTLLLTFRPFLVFRARWRRDGIMKQSGNASNAAEKPQQVEPPPWLDEACESCLEGARCMIRHLHGACQINQYVREINYHGFHLETACFTLSFDMMHCTRQAAKKHLPWVRMGLRCMASLIAGNKHQNQNSLTMNAIQQMTIAVFPELATASGPDLSFPGDSNGNVDSTPVSGSSTYAFDNNNSDGRDQNYGMSRNDDTQIGSDSGWPMRQGEHQQSSQQAFRDNYLSTLLLPPLVSHPSPSRPFSSSAPQNYNITNAYTNPSNFFNSLGQNLMADPGGSNVVTPNNSSTTDDLAMADFTQADIPIDWKDFDFSTMDLETFMSVDPTNSSAANINNHAVDYSTAFGRGGGSVGGFSGLVNGDSWQVG